MEFVKSQFDRIQRQLNGLSASQKMLTGSLVAIMVMTLMMWGRYAGEAEYVPVLEQSLSQEELSRITSELSARGIVPRTEGGRVLVPEDRRIEALAHIGYGQMLPSNFSASFDEVVKSINPFESSTISSAKLAQAKNRTLGLIIGAFDPVQKAVVYIDTSSKRAIGGDVEPTANISIFMKRRGATPSAIIQKTVNAAADVAMGAQAGLRADRIKVNVDGVPCKVQNADAAGGMDGREQLAAIKDSEYFYQQKIREHLSYIQSLIVSDTVTVVVERSEKMKKKFPTNAK
jgi:flagellar biosynthesis/type III secretory pathway M-ring protein FliF/YscJ